MIFIGVDPGVSGGIAFIDHNGVPIRTAKMPETERDLFELLTFGCIQTAQGFQIGDALGHRRAMLERAGATPQMGVTSAFTFGMGYGRVRMALVAAGCPFDVVTSHVWQKAMGCRSGGDKNVTKRRAQDLFPQVKVTHAIADALLLAEYCRRMEQQGHGKEEEGIPVSTLFDSYEAAAQAEAASVFNANVEAKANKTRRRARAH